MDSFSSNPLDHLEIDSPMCTQIELQYGNLEISTAKNVGTGLSAGSGTGTGIGSGILNLISIAGYL